ncbi:DDHD domain-containing protein [Ectocarpus siliculosus]|uniref:DDHD domain-containing protein n=1 Tax=Ectocarpus siliculosus TaxID=2880 RepID=D8LNU2_ECTSI|nr:DDHD domain-containing protein [Ectocarpus siliculosus]|eukprot:CBN78302.1 DDHD domain-containing protein [Ectocarpus siliculosus]
MSISRDSPTPSWLVQEPEGHGAPKTPGHWKTMWASDCARLEEAHHRGDAEVLVYGRKYVVDMKARTVRALYWDEKPAGKPIIRATYFLEKGSGWLPFSEKDAELLEDAYAAAKVQLRSKTFSEAEIPLSDGENKVVMTKVKAGESVDDYFADFDIDLQQKPVKVPSMLVSTIYKTAFQVRRGTPEASGWGGVSATDGDIPLEGEPPKHLVFVIHGIGESLWSRKSSAMASLRASMGPMRDMSAELLRDLKKASKLEEAAAAAAAAAAAESTAAAEKDDTTVVEAKEDDAKCFVTKAGGGCEAKGEGVGSKDSEEGDNDGDEESGGYVEFLPVEWFHQVHGNEAVAEGMIQDITLKNIPGFRDFASQAIMDVMYYLTPDMQVAILKVVGEQMNEMWNNFCRFTPDFSGKVSVMGHSLGSIIAHDILMAQPVKGETQIAEDAVGKDIPLLSFYPEVLLACGSPIGTFLSLRQSTLDKKRLFKFHTTNRFFNLYHLYDPVAYRLEPLLDKRLRDLQPLHVPHRGGDRIHVSVKKFNRGVNAAIGRMTKSTGKGWNIIQSSINTTIKSAIGDPGTTNNEEPIASEEVTDAEDELDERIDWVIQESTLEGMHPWASAVFAHSSYFTNFDMVMFLVNRLNEGLEGEGEEEGDSKESEEGRKTDEGSKAEEEKEEGSTREETKVLELVA